MSRRTDTERGALIALAICDQQTKPQLFPRDLDRAFWLEIHHQACAQLDECDRLNHAVSA